MILKRVITLDYLDGPNVSTRVLLGGKQEDQSEPIDRTMNIRRLE